MENMSQKCVNRGVDQGHDGKCAFTFYFTNPPDQGKFTIWH